MLPPALANLEAVKRTIEEAKKIRRIVKVQRERLSGAVRGNQLSVTGYKRPNRP